MKECMTFTKEELLGELYKCRHETSMYIHQVCASNDVTTTMNALDKIKKLAEKEKMIRIALEHEMYTEKPIPVKESLRNDIKRIFGR